MPLPTDPTPPTSADTVNEAQTVLSTPSELGLDNYPVPSEIIRDLIQQEWISSERAPRPIVYAEDDLDNPGKGMLNRSDYVVVSFEGREETQANYRYEYVDTTDRLTIYVKTNKNRQRLYNLIWEVRRIVYKWSKSLVPWQQVYLDGYQEQTDNEHRVWDAVVSIRGTNRGVPVFTGVAAGEEPISITPEDAGSGVDQQVTPETAAGGPVGTGASNA